MVQDIQLVKNELKNIKCVEIYEKMKKIRFTIRRVITGIVSLSFVCGIYELFHGQVSVGVVITWGVILCCCIYFWFIKECKFIKERKCPSCKKLFGLQEENTEVVNKEKVSVPVQTKMRNNNGEVFGTQEQYVPGERITYRVNYKCKECGEKCYRTYTKSVPYV